MGDQEIGPVIRQEEEYVPPLQEQGSEPASVSSALPHEETGFIEEDDKDDSGIGHAREWAGMCVHKAVIWDGY